jgi:hypothetical protein
MRCPMEGCDQSVTVVKFVAEQCSIGIKSPDRRKPNNVKRVFQGICPMHGSVSVIDDGHHITMEDFWDYGPHGTKES